MSGGYPIGLDICETHPLFGNNQQYYGGRYIAPSATANVKGAWTQISGGIARDTAWITIDYNYSAGGLANCQTGSLDLGIGPGGSENVLVGDLVYQSFGSTSVNRNLHVSIPLQIAAGTRIAARTQINVANHANNDFTCTARYWPGGIHSIEGAAGVDTIGFVSANTRGTVITPGNAAYGSYSQLTAATPRDYQGFFCCFDNANNTQIQSPSIITDIAVGAGGSEKVIYTFSTVQLVSSAGGGMNQAPFQYLPISIPAGTRIAARGAEWPFTADAIVNYGITFYGVYR